MNVYKEQRGNPDKPALVLLHGWGMNSCVWNSVLPLLEAHFYLTLIDLPGLGQSVSCPEPYNSQTVVDTLLEAAPERAAWLGWSLGGQLAIRAAALAPERVDKLITVASSPCFVQRENWPCAMAAETYQSFAGALIENPDKTLTRFAMLQTQGAEAGRPVLKQLKSLLKESSPPTALPESLGLLEDDERALLAQVKQPVWMSFGEKDLLVPGAAAQACQLINAAVYTRIYTGAGHLPFLSHAEQWVSDLRYFMESGSL
ncbi:MAG: alpha/beta fold hydrolase [Pontibacterium sp.]